MKRIFDPGDRVSWPQTQMPAGESGRSIEVEDTDTVRYASGRVYVKYLYKGLHDRMVEDMKANVEEEFDNLVIVTGDEGSGKSNEAYYTAKAFDPDFDMSKSLVYSWGQFLQSVTEDPQRVYWFDEAVLVAAGRDWMKESNKMLVKSLQIIRSMRLTIIMNIPSFDAIDVYIRTFRTRYMIKAHVMKWSGDKEARRGYAELFVPKTKEERRALPKDALAEDYFRSVGFFRFPKMDGEAKSFYDLVKAKNQKEALMDMRQAVEESSGASRYKRDKQSLTRLVSYMADVQGLSYQEIADIAEMPYNTVKGMAWRERNKEAYNEG